jgi:DNA-binding NarL/FixJ family response regulator
MKTKHTILLVEDEVLIRDGVHSLLKAESFVGKIFHAAGKKDIAEIPLGEIDVVILDFKLRDCNGLDVIPLIKQAGCHKIVIMTGLEGNELIINLLRAGVQAIIHKLDGYNAIRSGLIKVLEGDTYYPPYIIKTLKDNIHHWDKIPPVKLSFGEQEIITAISQGYTTKQIAGMLKMTEATTETYRLRLIKKLGVPNTAAMIVYAFKNGIL